MSQVSISTLDHPSASSESYTSPCPVQALRFHPHAQGIHLAVSPQQLSLMSMSSEVGSWKCGSKQFWDAIFSLDGRQIVSSSKDGVIALWDARSDAEGISVNNHNGIKPIKLACVGDLIFSTGFSKVCQSRSICCCS